MGRTDFECALRFAGGAETLKAVLVLDKRPRTRATARITVSLPQKGTGGDGVRISRKGIVRARGVCGWSVAEAVEAWAQAWRGDAQNGAGMCGGMLLRVTGRGGGGGRGVGGWGSSGSERLELCAGGHGVRRLLQGGSLRVAATQVLAFVQLQARLIRERWAP